MDVITTTIDREWFAQIVVGTKRVEYREIKPYWTNRLRRVRRPFRLVPRNGMSPPIPVVTVLIDRVTPNPNGIRTRVSALRGLPIPRPSTHSPGGGKTVSVPSTLVPEPHERCRPNDYQITTRGKASCCPDGRRSVRGERCADVPRQADRPVGTLRCR